MYTPHINRIYAGLPHLAIRKDFVTIH